MSQCQQVKIQRHTVTPVRTFTTPDARFAHVHVDIVGPLPSSQGYRYLMTAVDRFTCWPEVVPLVDITAVSTARAFVSGWISRFGIPAFITTDHGSQFESTLVKELSHMLGCEHIRTTAYHPCANGLVEHFHRQLKASLKACMNPSGWVDALSDTAKSYPQATFVSLSKSLQFEWSYLQRLIPNIGSAFTPVWIAINTSFWPAIFDSAISQQDQLLF